MQQLWDPVKITTLVFIRHAQAADRDVDGHQRMCGWLDVPLTSHGQLEAECLRNAVVGLGSVAAVYTSSLQRAVDTASPMARALGVRPHSLNSLREISCGELEGVPVVEVRRRYAQLWQANSAQDDEAFRWPGGESYRAFRGRVLRTLGRLRRVHAGSTILIVTHAGVVSQVLGSLAGESAAGWERFRPGPASVTEVRWTGERGVVVRFDDRRHLVDLRSPDRVRTTDDTQVLTHCRHSPESLTGRAAGAVHGDN